MNALLASIPSPDRGVWHVVGVPVRAYALCIIVGIIVAIWWGDRRFVARGGAKGTVVDMAVFAVPFGLVGGRIYHVLTDWDKYFGTGADPVDALKIWQGGLGIWGAISFGALGAWIFARRRGVPLTALADSCAPGIVVAQAIGRIGNWFNQELYGGATTLPWGLEIYRRVDPDTGEQDTLTGIADGGPAIAVVHPTFLYELLWNLGVALLVVLADRRFRLGRGRVFALYVVGYTAGRFWIELMREDPATMVLGTRINVITSVVVFLAAVAYLVLVRGPRENLATTDPAAAEDDLVTVSAPASADSAAPAAAAASDPSAPSAGPPAEPTDATTSAAAPGEPGAARSAGATDEAGVTTSAGAPGEAADATSADASSGGGSGKEAVGQADEEPGGASAAADTPAADTPAADTPAADSPAADTRTDTAAGAADRGADPPGSSRA